MMRRTSSSGQIAPKTYAHSVSGHHLLLKYGHGRILKASSPREDSIYESVFCDEATPGSTLLRSFIPQCWGTREIAYEGQSLHMIVLEDVCSGLQKPCVLDIKMGTRQFGLGASEKKKHSKILKAKETTTETLGLRLCGLKLWLEEEQLFSYLSKYDCRYFTDSEVSFHMQRFLSQNVDLCRIFLGKVHELLDVMKAVNEFRFFTSSLLMVYDAENKEVSPRIVMVDFAYTYKLEELKAAQDPDGDTPYDVGYVKGLVSLASILESCCTDADENRPVGGDTV